MEPREKHFTAQNSKGAHHLTYSDWGPEGGQPIMCVHGLTGNGFDFDYLAPTLANHGYRLICPDLPGRGRSDFLPDPLDYNYDQYIADLTGLMDHLGLSQVDWLGVSLGGLLGIKLAGTKDSPIRRLIINDVGPEVPQKALDFIHMVISQIYTFDSIKELEQRMRATRSLTWGPVTDEQWAHMAAHNNRKMDDGKITYAYDPRIAVVFETAPTGDVDLWPYWDEITCPVLVLQGKKSLLLTKKIIKQMRKRSPSHHMDLHVFKDCGHVPSLMAPGQISVIEEWLNKTPIS